MREQLRQATADIHERLDRTAGHQPKSARCDYVAFLQAQNRARCAVERALCVQPPAGIGAPPRQSSLLQTDLHELGVEPEEGDESLDLPDGYAALGAAWVLAGSSMGNRAMLARRRKYGIQGPERFLSDSAMPAYFRDLLEVLGNAHTPAALRQAIKGARATFLLFEEAFASHSLERAA